MSRIPQPSLPTLPPGLAIGVVEEMRFWLQTMSDHAKIIRGGLDVCGLVLKKSLDFTKGNGANPYSRS